MDFTPVLILILVLVVAGSGWYFWSRRQAADLTSSPTAPARGLSGRLGQTRSALGEALGRV
ncbi:MAG TPA: hypothetical protein VFT54_07840, partial [Acidimicrobiia bacterium]|nr:hypothetical protein [Acidimicrobiia bacterium]